MNKQRKRIVPNVVRGGTAIPIGDNLFYMKGRKHEQGGIDIGDNAKTGLEVEGGEVVQTSPKSIKVFSSVPFLYGGSPANLVMSGADPNKVFNAQEEFKDKNNINDDGTKKENGGNKNLNSLVDYILSRPANFVQRLKDKNRKVIRDWEDTTKVATHKLGAEYVDEIPVIYPNVQEIDGELIDFTRPPYDTWSGLDNAIERGDTIQVKTLQDAIDFTENYKDYISSMKQYKNGGLSRSKNYGSSKKPYPSVKSEDFAGGNRSYPIPTKADAVDALRLAGLHGRSDVKTKVYKKYPELRKKGFLGLEEPIDSLSIVPGLNVPTITAYTNNYLDSLNRVPSSNPAIITASRKKLPNIVGYANTNMSKDSLDIPEIPITKLNNVDSLFQQKYKKPINQIYIDGLSEDSFLNVDNTIPELNVIRDVAVTPSSINSLTVSPVVSKPNPNIRENNSDINEVTRINLGLPIRELTIPNYNINDVITRSMMNYLEDDRKFADEPGISSNNTPITSQNTRTNNNNELQTFGNWMDTIIRNVPLPTTKAITNSGQNLDSRIKESINDRIKENIKNRNNKTSKNRNVIPAVLDSVGSLIDIGGNITSNILNRNMLNDLEYVDAPIPLLPNKLKTRININPQLERLYSDLAQMENAVNNNTTSSRTALARNQRLRNQVRRASNELYGNKENIETQLINRDRLNQQEVAARNLRDYNQWRREKSEFDNQIKEALAENNIALTQGIGQSLNTLIQNLQQRNLEAKNLAYLSMSNPYAIDTLNSTDFKNLYRTYGGFRCGGKKKVNKK